VVALGTKKGSIQDLKIELGKPDVLDIHTVTIYLSAKNQPEYYEYILGLKPQRIIFNPGTYNKEFIDLAKEKGIKTVNDCTLVMLSSGTF
jgi:predicted CoA-binding protein